MLSGMRFVHRALSCSCKQFSTCQQKSMSDREPRRKRQKELRRGRLVWVDLEMSGLDINTEHILEMACIVTDMKLDIIAESEDLVIHQPEEVLQGMGEWCTRQHGKSGLTEGVRNSTIALGEAEQRMLGFIQEHTEPGITPLAGNSVYMDRLFLMKYMPRFTEHLHYRIVDVSSIKELAKYWFPKELKQAPKKKCTHRALDDIKESIEELKFYKKHMFKDAAPLPYMGDSS